MRKRIAIKIIAQHMDGGRTGWRKGTLLAANDKLFGAKNRGMLAMAAWAPETARAALRFAQAVKTVTDAMGGFAKTVRPFAEQTNAELSA